MSDESVLDKVNRRRVDIKSATFTSGGEEDAA